MLDWQSKPPIVNFTIPSENFTAIIQLPYHADDIPLLFDRVFGVKIREPHLYFFKAGIPIQYHAIATGDNIEYLRNPMNGTKFVNEEPSFNHQNQDNNNGSGDNGPADNNSSGTTNQQTGSLTSGASGASDIVGGNSNSNSGSPSTSGDSGSSSSNTKERPNGPPRRDYND